MIVRPTSIPAEAAELISKALSFEAEERLEESVAAYRWLSLKTLISHYLSAIEINREAIGKLLSEVQSDPDVKRQAQVERNTSLEMGWGMGGRGHFGCRGSFQIHARSVFYDNYYLLNLSRNISYDTISI